MLRCRAKIVTPMLTPWLFGLALFLSAPANARVGTLAGRVTILDRGHARKNAGNVVIWIEEISSRAGGRRAPREQMESIHKSFLPRVLAVAVGTTVDFPNSDPIFHNVFSVSGGNRFDLGLYRRGTSRSKQFDEPGLVRVYCNIHPQMVGYIWVLDTNAYAVSRADGGYRIDDIPSGDRTVHVWSEETGEQTEKIRITEAQTTTFDPRLDATGFTPLSHKNKYGKNYPPPPPDDERY
jgi:plastocyanin